MAFNKTKSLKLADKHIAKQNFNKALNELLKVAKETPNDANLLNKIGDLYSKVGNTKNAIDYFLKVATSYQKGGFNLKAIALYKKIVRIDSRYMDARHRLVDLYIQQGHHSESKGELRRMAEQYYSENLFPRALSCYEKMVEIEPNNLDARLKITEILIKEGRREQATDHFIAMGKELLEKTMVNEAKKIITQGLKISPKNIGLLVLLSRTLLAEGKTDEALTRLTNICEKDESNLEALKILGQTYASKGQLIDAKACFLRALHLSDQETASLEELSEKFIEAGQIEEAFQTIVPVGDIYIEKEEYDEAVRLFRSILYADENHEPSLEMLVTIYGNSQQTANAVLTLEKMVHLYLDRDEKQRAIKNIEKLLELDPNNQEWRDKLDELTGGSSAAGSPVNDEIHVFGQGLEEDMDTPSGLSDDHDPSPSLSLEPDDPQAKVANHLTEADVFMKYGILDQALTHLLEAQTIEPNNEEANSKLKQIYLEKNDEQAAVLCLVRLVNACIEKQDFHRAKEFIDEIEEYRPDVARQHRGRLETLAHEESVRSGESQGSFDLDFNTGAMDPVDGLDFGAPPQADVVDFRDMQANDGSGFDVGFEEDQTEEAWSLDMPDSGTEDGLAEDLQDLYAPGKDQTLSEGAAELPGLEALRAAHGNESLADQGDITLPPQEEVFEEADKPEDYIEIPEADSGIIELGKIEPSETPPAAEEPAEESPAPEIKNAAQDALSTHAPLESNQGSLASELEEIDFFISVEAFDDANNLISEARKKFGEHPLILERLQEVQAKTQADHQEVAFQNRMGHADVRKELGDAALIEDPASGFFDLAAELSEELFEEEGGDVSDNTSKEDIQSVEELFQEFKKGVDEQIDEGDHETHYDLGIAYKEMGLLEEAISEFEKANQDRNRFLDCATMVGSCLIELGRADEAITHFQEKLAVEGISSKEEMALRYELALAFQGFGELEKALELLLAIKEIDPKYRDLESLIQELV